jgi:hypothetical protein
VEIVTVAATRGSVFSLSEMEMLVGSALVIALLVWMGVTRLRRGEHTPNA